MVSFTYGIQTMAQMNPSMYRNRLRDIANRLMVAIGGDVGEGRTGSFGLADANLYIYTEVSSVVVVQSPSCVRFFVTP